jgi:chromosome segregation ATPase
VQTDDVEHHQKAKELQEQWDKLSMDHKVAMTRAEQSHAMMKQLREKLSKTASSDPKFEADAHSSRQVVEEEEEMDTTGLDDIPTPGQRRVEEEKRRRAIKDRRDAKLHPKCKTLTEQINAANNAHSKYVPLLTAATCANKPCFERLIDTGAIFLTATKLEETTQKRQDLASLKAHQRQYGAQIHDMQQQIHTLATRIEKGEGNMSSVRKQINDLANSDQTNRIRYGFVHVFPCLLSICVCNMCKFIM